MSWTQLLTTVMTWVVPAMPRGSLAPKGLVEDGAVRTLSTKLGGSRDFKYLTLYLGTACSVTYMAMSILTLKKPG